MVMAMEPEPMNNDKENLEKTENETKGVKTYICDICGYRITTDEGDGKLGIIAEDHERTWHPGEEVFRYKTDEETVLHTVKSRTDIMEPNPGTNEKKPEMTKKNNELDLRTYTCDACGYWAIAFDGDEEAIRLGKIHNEKFHPREKIAYYKSDDGKTIHGVIIPREMDIPESEEFEFDLVDNPAHYAKGSLECKDWIRIMLSNEAYEGWLKGNALKYIWRFHDKGQPIQDLEKARKYLEFLVDHIERLQAEDHDNGYFEIKEDFDDEGSNAE